MASIIIEEYISNGLTLLRYSGQMRGCACKEK